jgi:hypothetical protein
MLVSDVASNMPLKNGEEKESSWLCACTVVGSVNALSVHACTTNPVCNSALVLVHRSTLLRFHS